MKITWNILRGFAFVMLLTFVAHAMDSDDSSKANSWLIRIDGVDRLRLGDSVKQVYAKYGKENVTYRQFSPDSGGTFYELEIQLADNAHVKAYLDAPLRNDANEGATPKLTSIMFTDPKFKTSDGIAVGSTIEDLARVYQKKPVLFPANMGCWCAARIPDGKMVFGIDYGDTECCSPEEAAKVPKSVKVDSIIIGRY